MAKNGNNTSNIAEELKAIKNARAIFKDKVQSTEEMIALAQELSEKVKWVVFKGIYDSSQTSGSPESIKKKLTVELKQLKNQIRELEVKEKSALLNMKIDERRNKLHEKISVELKKAEEINYIKDETLKQFVAEADSLLRERMNLLEKYPGVENIIEAIKDMEILYILGVEEKSTAVQDAWDIIRNKSKQVWKIARDKFNQDPSTENLKSLFNRMELHLIIGGTLRELTPAGWNEVVRTREKNASYRIENGDTLRMISRMHYGKENFWDIIYIENFGDIGKDPDKLPVGISITIP